MILLYLDRIHIMMCTRRGHKIKIVDIITEQHISVLPLQVKPDGMVAFKEMPEITLGHIVLQEGFKKSHASVLIKWCIFFFCFIRLSMSQA